MYDKGETTMKYFESCKTLDELKAEYRRLAMANHPDRGGDVETMKQIEIYSSATDRRAKKPRSGHGITSRGRKRWELSTG